MIQRRFMNSPATSVLVLAVYLFFGFVTPSSRADEPPRAGETGSATWKPLVSHWKVASFGGEGEVEIRKVNSSATRPESGATPSIHISMGCGEPLTGVVWGGDLPRENYELRLETRRTEGFDFPAAITFPVGKQACSFVMGGWGGSVLGISSINEKDASENETTIYQDIDNDRWYKVLIRVDGKQITVTVDDKRRIRLSRQGRSFTIRGEMYPCLPLGIANFECTSEVRHVQLRRLPSTNSSGKAAPSSGGSSVD